MSIYISDFIGSVVFENSHFNTNAHWKIQIPACLVDVTWGVIPYHYKSRISSMNIISVISLEVFEKQLTQMLMSTEK